MDLGQAYHQRDVHLELLRRTANSSVVSLNCPVIGQSLPSRARFPQGRKQSLEEVQWSSFLPDHLI